MSRTTGPILAVGAITLGNETVLNGRPLDWRVPAGTAIAAGIFALGERVAPQLVTAVAWVALATVVLTRVRPGVPAPAESLLAWWNGGEHSAPARAGAVNTALGSTAIAGL